MTEDKAEFRESVNTEPESMDNPADRIPKEFKGPCLLYTSPSPRDS